MALKAGFEWQVSPQEAFGDLAENYTKAVFTSGIRQAESRAKDMVEWAKANAPWEDDTGAARAGLNAIVKSSPGVIAEIVLQYGDDIDYGVWLELAHGGKFGIISKAIDVYGPIFMQDMQNLVNLKLITRG
jgi:hypothetical protein